MTEEQLIASFTDTTRLHANDGVERGLHPLHVANILMVAALQISVQFEGVEKTRAGLLLAADQIGAANG